MTNINPNPLVSDCHQAPVYYEGEYKNPYCPVCKTECVALASSSEISQAKTPAFKNSRDTMIRGAETRKKDTREKMAKGEYVPQEGVSHQKFDKDGRLIEGERVND